MMQVSCKDMGMMDCDFVAQGETMDDVMAKAMEHGKAAHAMTDEAMMADMEKMKSLVKQM